MRARGQGREEGSEHATHEPGCCAGASRLSITRACVAAPTSSYVSSNVFSSIVHCSPLASCTR